MNGPVTATAQGNGITVEVAPAGALQTITLTDAALALGRKGLARTILDLVNTATAKANQRAAHAVREDLANLSDDELRELGIGQSAALTESVEATPQQWQNNAWGNT